jgi:Cu/Ag efflux pump CusA
MRQIAFADHGEGYFEPRDIELGARAGDDVIVLKGLEAGERIATSANFLIDSESQAQAALGSFAPPPPGAGAAACMNLPQDQVTLDYSSGTILLVLTGIWILADLRSLQDWVLRYQLRTVPGVAEVASIGGFVRQYQVRLDPGKLRAYNIPLSEAQDRSASKKLGASGVTYDERRRILLDAAKQVGPALFFSLLIIVVSFFSVFLLEAQEGRMFRPLAWTKTLAVAFSSVLAITLHR